MTYRDRLIALVEIYCIATGLTREQLSYRVFKDQRRLARVAAGQATITLGSLDAALAWLAANWPSEVDWPDFIARPDLEAAQ